MKKITLLLTLFFCAIFGYAQTGPLSEGFEGGVPPTGWIIANGANGLGGTQVWQLNTASYPAHTGDNAAFVNNENIGINNTEENWLISRSNPIPTDGQLRFFTRQTLVGEQNTIYQVRVATVSTVGAGNQATLTDYAIVKQWTEEELSSTSNVEDYVEKTVDLPASYIGQNVYIAFVRVYTQPGTGRTGDRWLVDDVRVVPKCKNPAELDVNPASITSTSAVLSWANPGLASSWEVEIVPSGTTPTQVGAVVNSNTVNTNTIALYNPLSPGVTYEYYVRALCTDDVKSDWIGPFIFTTLPLGSVCANPIVITTPNYQVIGGNTANYGDEFDTTQGTFSSCGATPAGTNYLAGDEVFYSYTASASGTISIRMTPVGTASTNSSIFVYNGPCSNVGASCIAGLANSNTSVRSLSVNVVAGNTYIIVISSSAATQSIAYNLLIQQENCVPVPDALTATDPTLVGATLSWGNTGNYSSWDVAVQPLGSLIPSGAGTDTVTGTPSLIKTGLNAGTQYQYWVRAECTPGSGIYTSWAGPFAFNTLICAPADQCTYIFRMNDSASNGWNGARMQIRQNGIVVATIGDTFNSGAGPINISVPLCQNVPFDVYWSVAGTLPQQCILTIINSFGQTIYTKPAGTGTAGAVVYSDTVKCDAPQCNIAPTSVTVTNVGTNGATINWDAPATTSWDIYVYPVGSPAPTASTVPTYDNVTTNGFATTIPLIPDTGYNVCVRVNCTPAPSPWTCATFTTIPTCPRPLSQTVPAAGITNTAAVLNWVPGTATDNLWEILLIPGPDLPVAPGVNPELVPGAFLWTTTNASPYTYTAEGLQPATIYYYYIRTVCPGDDKSKWTGPIKFNTLTCATADKCNYRFVMTDTAGNGWNGARMQVRQNGIVIQTIGQSIGGAGPTTVTVALCSEVPFDLFWSVEGDAPAEIGLTIQNPFTDIIYTKVPGVGTPLTVLYADNTLGNCTPPTCPKPTALAVVAGTISQTEVQLTWTESGTATSWEVYAVPVGSPAPVNGTPLNTGIANYHLVTGPLPYTLTGLLPGTAYIFYVRAICSSSDIGTWTLLNPVKFNTKPVNDDCAMAINVSVNPVWECNPALYAHGSTLGATLSPPAATGTGCVTMDDDVWFKFTATNNIHTVNLNNIVGAGPNGPITATLNHALYSGTCDNLTLVSCFAGDESVLTNLVPGTVYYIKVYTAASVATQSASFDVCIGTPPPPATNDECATAINITVNQNSKCNFTTAGNLIGATASPQANGCIGNDNDDVWFTFTATATTHYLSILNVLGTTENINHAVYSGECGALVQKYCSTANSLTSNSETFVVGQTYYLRVWSNSALSQVVTFDVCIKSASSCDTAERLCGSSEEDPFIYENTTGLPGAGPIACLGSSPNPTYYTLHIGHTGNIQINILQNTAFDSNGQPVGQTLDVDYVAWGPFSTNNPTQNCSDIVFGPCSPVACPNNTSNANFYPVGNILDCSYDGSFTETLHIPNAQEGEYYILLVTNFSGNPGFIRLIQTNYTAPDAGQTICCAVELGPDISVCAESTTLNALTGITDLENTPSTFQWYFNGVLIPDVTGSTYVATQSGTYKVTGNCGINLVNSEVVVILGPVIQTTTPADYVVCDDASNDGFGSFNLQLLTPQVLGTLDPALYTVTYYLTPDAAAIGGPGIDITALFTSTSPLQIIYIRVQSNALATCFSVVPVNLIVTPLKIADFNYPLAQYCRDAANPSPVFINNGTAGEFGATPAGLSINPTTGEINLAASTAGTYDVTNTFAAAGGCGVIVSHFTVKLTDPVVATFDFGTGMYCKDGGIVNPIFAGPNAGPGTFTSTPAGLSINPTTGAIDLANSAAGTYQVTNEVTASGGCQADIKNATVIVTEPASGTISYNSPFCKSSTTSETVIGVFTPGGTFSAGSGLSIDAVTGAISPSSSTPGDYLVVYTVAAFEGCDEYTTNTPVTIIPESTIDFVSGCDSGDFIVTATPSGGVTGTVYTYSWTGPVFEPTDLPGKIVVKVKGTYAVTITTPDGCQTTESTVLDDILCDVQRGISPNGDGKNEDFDLSTLNVRHLSIFNRYGTEVYQYDNYKKEWHGQSNTGEALPDSTYFYVIDRGDGKTSTGWIYINR